MNHQPHPSEAIAASPLLSRCEPSLPGHAYRDPAWFQAEREKIWRRSWLYAGRAGDLPPMTLRRLELAGENLFLVKGRDGQVSCFHNTCRHRGAELCPAPERPLKGRLITCPYHQWAYDMTGRLVGTPYVSVTPDFAKEDHGLFSLPVREWNGFVFVCLSDDPPPFADAPDLGEGALDNWPMRDLVTGHRMTVEIACNWKVFWENYNECLHCPGIHKNLSHAVPIYGKGYMAPNEAPSTRADVSAMSGGLREGRRSWTVSGEPCGPEFPGLTPPERAAGQRFVTLLPTVFVVAHADYVRAVSLKPLSPERTELTAEWLFSPETLAQPGFDLANVVDFAAEVLAEDAAACEMNQRGLSSSRFERGVLTPQEYEIFRFHEWLRERLGGEPS
jgi:glycine betaine catabolism A